MEFLPHYSVQKIETIDDLKKIFPDGQANELNWCFLSTSGVHGTYTTLDDIESYKPEGDEDETRKITVLVVHPRLVVLRYGHIEITPEDIPYLRQLVRSTLEAVKKSQEGNI